MQFRYYLIIILVLGYFAMAGCFFGRLVLRPGFNGAEEIPIALLTAMIWPAFITDGKDSF